MGVQDQLPRLAGKGAGGSPPPAMHHATPLRLHVRSAVSSEDPGIGHPLLFRRSVALSIAAIANSMGVQDQLRWRSRASTTAVAERSTEEEHVKCRWDGREGLEDPRLAGKVVGGHRRRRCITQPLRLQVKSAVSSEDPGIGHPLFFRRRAAFSTAAIANSMGVQDRMRPKLPQIAPPLRQLRHTFCQSPFIDQTQHSAPPPLATRKITTPSTSASPKLPVSDTQSFPCATFFGTPPKTSDPDGAYFDNEGFAMERLCTAPNNIQWVSKNCRVHGTSQN